MFYFVKKERILWVLAGVMAVAVLVYCGSNHKKQMAEPAASTPMEGKIVVIDPGHGGLFLTQLSDIQKIL